jgi:hypothetical protein
LGRIILFFGRREPERADYFFRPEIEADCLAGDRRRVLVCIGSSLIVAPPDREVALGRVDPEAQQIIVLREQGPAGPIYDFKVGDIVEPSSQAAGIGSLESRAGMN